MSKKRKYIVKAQNGLNLEPMGKPEDPMGNDPLLNWMTKWEQAGFNTEGSIDEAGNQTFQFSRGTGQYDFNPYFKAFNPIAQLVTGIANKVNDVKASRDEYQQWVRALQPQSYEAYREGTGKAPVLAQTGGNINRRLTPDEMYQWNQYLDFVKSKGLQGSTDLDLRDKKLGDTLFNEFKSANPNVTIGYDIVPHVQNEFVELQKTTRDFLRRKGDPNAESAYSDISPVDGWFGSKTSQQYFPSLQQKNYHNGQLQSVQEKGLVTGDLKPVGGKPIKQVAAPANVPKNAFQGQDGFWYVDDPNNPGDVKRVTMQTGGRARKAELEEGEIYEDVNGDLNKIAEGAGTHEEGGVMVNDASRVLEDTSDKRKDKVSKGLKLDPETIELLTGHRPSTSMSHSKAMEFAKENINKQTKKIENKLKKNVESVEHAPTNNFAQSSLKFNMLNLGSIPSEGETFDALFQHQEITKQAMGVNSKSKYQVGGFARPPATGDQKKYYYFDEATQRWFKRGTGPQVEATSSVDQPQQPGFARPPLGNGQNYFFDEATQRWFKKPLVAGMSTESPSEKLPLNLDPIDPNNLSGLVPDQPQVTLGGGSAQGSGRDFRFLPQPKSQFNEPLRWFDVAGPIQSLLERRIPVQYDGIDLGGSINLQHQNALPTLQAGERDFRAALEALPENSQGYANAANLFARKYGMDAQVLGQYSNINANIDNQEVMQNTGLRQAQAQADLQSREAFERKVLGSKEAARQQQLQAWDDLYTRLAMNRKLNREGNLLMKLYPAFDQYGEYNGYNVPIHNPLSMPQNFNPNTSMINSTRQAPGFSSSPSFGKFEFQFPTTTQTTSNQKSTTSSDFDNNGGLGFARPPLGHGQNYYFDEATQRWFKKTK